MSDSKSTEAVDGSLERDGTIPTNPSDRLKAKGYPIAASGVVQLVELYEQLLGAARARQLPSAVDVGLASTVGGFGNCAIVTVVVAGRIA